MITKSQKSELIQKLSEDLSRSKAAFLFDFKGLKVEEMTHLRKSLSQAKFQIVKNTLALKTLKNHPEMEKALSSELKGTNALFFVYDKNENLETLKPFFEYKKEDGLPLLIKKAFMYSYGVVSHEQMKNWSLLPSKNLLRQKLLFVLQTPLRNFLCLLKSPSTTFVRLLKAYEGKKKA